MSYIQQQGEAMMDCHGFLGVPVNSFEIGGRQQLIRLLQHGLLPESKILDIGCGCLRVAYWLIQFLQPDGYHGIEPVEQRVQLGKQYLLSESMLHAKRPKFDFNPSFDTGVFGEKFDFYNAGSIWTHCSKTHIEIMLDGFLENAVDNATFLTSYLPALDDQDDYMGNDWVGTSHESDTPGVIRHSKAWIEQACRQRNLVVQMLPEMDCDSQFWIKINKRG